MEWSALLRLPTPFVVTVVAFMLGLDFCRRFSTRKKSSLHQEKQATNDDDASNNNKLTVVLDLDECLVHVDKTGNFRTDTAIESFALHLDPDLCNYQVHLRPGWKDLLDHLAGNPHQYQVHLFTASKPTYAQPIVSELERRLKEYNPTLSPVFSKLWFRDDCRQRTVLGQVFTFKDLRVLFNHDKTLQVCRTVLIDDDPTNFMDNPDHGIPVKPFVGQDPWDDSLDHVRRLIQALEPLPDVRPTLQKQFGLADVFQEARECHPFCVPRQWEFVMHQTQSL